MVTTEMPQTYIFFMHCFVLIRLESFCIRGCNLCVFFLYSLVPIYIMKLGNSSIGLNEYCYDIEYTT